MGHAWLVIFGFLGCRPAVTGSNAMVGRLLASDGRPIAGARVESVEGESITDGTGRFSVNIKETAPFVHVNVASIWYRRYHLVADDGRIVDIVLPERAPLRVGCAKGLACELSLQWPLGDGWSAQWNGGCRALELNAAPTTAPQAICTSPNGERAAVQAVRTAEGLRVEPVSLPGSH